MEAAGIELASEDDATDSAVSSCENQQVPCAALALQYSDSNCLNLASVDADLQEVVTAWSDIPHSIRQAILVLAHSTARPEE